VCLLGAAMMGFEIYFVLHARHARAQVIRKIHEDLIVPTGKLTTGKVANEHAIVAFTADDGTEVTLETPHLGLAGVDVLYLPEHPERAQVDTPLTMWGVPALVLLAGAGVLGLWRRVHDAM